MKKTILQSVAAGYLPANWRESAESSAELVRVESGHLCLPSDIIETEEGQTFHRGVDSDLFGWDEWDEVYRLSDNLVEAYGRRGREIMTDADNCLYIAGEYFVNDDECLRENDIIETEEGDRMRSDDAYYWDSDECYHSTPEPRADLWGYHDGPGAAFYVNEDPAPGFQKFGFGIEIEKSERPDFDFNKNKFYTESGACLERDSSVPSGFELVSPTYNLFSKVTDERIKSLERFANVRGVDGAGGHIGFSREGVNDVDLLHQISGFLPLIYAMHFKRVSNSYCRALSVDGLIEAGGKYQSVRLRGSYIELRIFGPVRTFAAVLFRLELFRCIALNLGASFREVLDMATTKNTRLNTLLLRVYDTPAKFRRLFDNANTLTAYGDGSGLDLTEFDELAARIPGLFPAAEVGGVNDGDGDE